MENTERDFYIKALVDVYEDNYTDGELDWVNCYGLDLIIKASNINEAIKEFFYNGLCFNIDLKNLEYIEKNKSFSYNVLCDADNNEVNEKDNIYKKWLEGEIDLYSNNISLYVYELNLIKSLDK